MYIIVYTYIIGFISLLSIGGESYGREDRSNETDGPFMRSVSEQEPAQSAVTALDEAFSHLDNMKDIEEIYENKVLKC